MADIKDHVSVIRQDQNLLPGGEGEDFWPPHHWTHEDGGNDEVNVQGLSGKLADLQDAGWLVSRPIESGIPNPGETLVWNDVSGEWEYGASTSTLWDRHASGYLYPKVATSDTLQMGVGNLTNPTYAYAGYDNTGHYYDSAASAVVLAYNGIKRMQVSADETRFYEQDLLSSTWTNKYWRVGPTTTTPWEFIKATYGETSIAESVLKTFAYAGSTGYLSGGTITDAGSQLFDIAAGTGFLRTTDNATGDISIFSWVSSTGNTITDGTVRYVFVDYNSGSPQIVVKTTFASTKTTEFFLGSVVREGTVLHVHNDPDTVTNIGSRLNERLRHTDPTRVEGLILSEIATRYVHVTAGEVYSKLNERLISEFNSSVADTFATYVGATLDTASNTQWDNQNYDNAGVKTAMTTNRYGNLWVYQEVDGDVVIVYGTSNEATELAANDENPPTTLPARIVSHGYFIGRILFQKGATSATQIFSAFIDEVGGGGGSGGVSLPSGEIGYGTGTGITSSPDLYWHPTNKRLGIGNNNPTFAIHVTGLNENQSSGIFARYSNDSGSSQVSLRKSRSPSIGGVGAVLSGDVLGRFSFHGANGSAFPETAYMAAEAAANFSGSVQDTQFSFYTMAGTTSQLCATFKPNRDVVFATSAGVGTTPGSSTTYSLCVATNGGTLTRSIVTGNSILMTTCTDSVLSGYSHSGAITFCNVSGYDHTLDTDYSLVAGRLHNVSGNYCAVFGNFQTIGADGDYGLTIGYSNTNSKQYAFVSGKDCKADWEHEACFSSVSMDTGDGTTKNIAGMVLSKRTTSTSQVVIPLANSGSDSPLTLENEYYYSFTCRILAASTTDGYHADWVYEVQALRHDGQAGGNDIVVNADLKNTHIWIGGSSAPGTVSFSANQTANTLEIKVTPTLSATTYWQVSISNGCKIPSGGIIII